MIRPCKRGCLNRAGISAEQLDRTQRALELHTQARELATGSTLRESIVGLINASLDLGLDCDALLAALPEDGSATDRLRCGGTRVHAALRRGGVQEALDATTPLLSICRTFRSNGAHLVLVYPRGRPRRSDPLPGSFAYVRRARARSGCFGIDLAFAPARALRAIAEAGVRNFEGARRMISEAIASFTQEADLYWVANAYGIHARLETSSGSTSTPPVGANLTRHRQPGSSWSTSLRSHSQPHVWETPAKPNRSRTRRCGAT